LLLFKDLLDKIFVFDTTKRLTIQQALAHPFLGDNNEKSVTSPTTVSNAMDTSGVSVSLNTDVYAEPDYNMTELEVYNTKMMAEATC